MQRRAELQVTLKEMVVVAAAAGGSGGACCVPCDFRLPWIDGERASELAANVWQPNINHFTKKNISAIKWTFPFYITFSKVAPA